MALPNNSPIACDDWNVPEGVWPSPVPPFVKKTLTRDEERLNREYIVSNKVKGFFFVDEDGVRNIYRGGT